MPSDEGALLNVKALKISVATDGGEVLPIIDTADISVQRGESLGIVGESGSGKSMLCRALIGTLARYGAHVAGGEIEYEGMSLADANERTWRRVRGRKIGYVPQSSMAGLNPVLTVGTQMLEAIKADAGLSASDAKEAALHYLRLVQLPRPEALMRQRSHELSGGMRQRIMIAAALARKPNLLLADEPTTALDVSVQADILALLRELRASLGMALVLVSHDLAVIEEVCDRVTVMYAGATIEQGPVGAVAQNPKHPYTAALMASRIDNADPSKPLTTIVGEPPLAGSWSEGCRFWRRCPVARDVCRYGQQPLMTRRADRESACLFAWEGAAEHV